MKEKNNSEWVDVHNDALMVSLGIRQPNLQPKDMSVWTKTPREKKILKVLRKRYKNSIKTKSMYIPKTIPVYDKLIVQIKPTKGMKTTYSHQCGQSDIPRILGNYIDNKGHNLVVKYRWLNKWYNYGILPFWRSKD
jgi:hypothetical protein